MYVLCCKMQVCKEGESRFHCDMIVATFQLSVEVA